MEYSPPPFFNRGPSLLTRLGFFALLSLVLLYADARFHYMEGMRKAVAVVLYPFQQLADMPGEARKVGPPQVGWPISLGIRRHVSRVGAARPIWLAEHSLETCDAISVCDGAQSWFSRSAGGSFRGDTAIE